MSAFREHRTSGGEVQRKGYGQSPLRSLRLSCTGLAEDETDHKAIQGMIKQMIQRIESTVSGSADIAARIPTSK